MVRVKQGVHLEFAAEIQVGFSPHGKDVIIKEKAQKTLHQYQLEGWIYKEGWSETLPPGVNTASIIAGYREYIYGNDDYKLVLQDKRTSTTLVFSSNDREHLHSCHYEGILLTRVTATFATYLVYAVEKTEGGYEIVVVNSAFVDVAHIRKEKRLKPVTAKPTWSRPFLSVCTLSRGGGHPNIVVTSAADRSLDIYYWDLG